MAAGSIKLQSNDLRVATVTFEDGAAGNVSVVVPKEGGVLASEGYAVAKSGDETIAGIKTFTSSPIVPTPTNGDNSTNVATTAFVKSKSESDSIGVGQTWQDVTGSRVAGTTYTNTTGKPIMVAVYQNYSAVSGAIISLYINGIVVVSAQLQTVNNSGHVIGIIPNNTTYAISIVGSGGIVKWSELR